MRTEFTRICFIIYYERPHLITKQLDFIHSYTSMTTLLVSHQENTTDKAARKEAKEVEQTTKLLYCTNSKQSTNKPSPPSQYTLRPTIGKHESFNNCTRNILFGDLPFPLFCWRLKVEGSFWRDTSCVHGNTLHHQSCAMDSDSNNRDDNAGKRCNHEATNGYHAVAVAIGNSNSSFNDAWCRWWRRC